jgi:hypothetical protein
MDIRIGYIPSEPESWNIAFNGIGAYIPESDMTDYRFCPHKQVDGNVYWSYVEPIIYMVIVGPSSPMCDVLFHYGVDVLASVEVLNADSLLKKSVKAEEW